MHCPISKSQYEYPSLDCFAHTLPTLPKCLGLTMDCFIIYLFVCDTCWKLHHPSELNNLKTPYCDAEDCPGLLYIQKLLADSSSKCMPTKILPHVPLEHVLQQISFSQASGTGFNIGMVPMMSQWLCCQYMIVASTLSLILTSP